MADGIIFDVDGTLWDTTPIVEKAWNDAIANAGIKGVTVTADRLKGLFGLPMMDIIDDILPGESLEVKEKILETCSVYEFDYIRKESGILYEGLEDALKYYKNKIPMFIVSNCQSGYIELFCDITGFGHYFDDHLCPGDTGLLKAGNICKIVEDNNLKNPVYVGDTQMDANACKEAGVPIVFAAYGFGKVESPDYIINKPMDLVNII